MDKLIYIILKNHDTMKFTIPCIKSLKKTTYRNKKILVVDDNSQDIPYIECKKMGVELIHLTKYSDFCKCFNVGIRYAIKNKADFIFVVNNDTRNFSVDYFENILNAFKDYKVGMVGTKCLNYDGTLQWGRKPHVVFDISMNVPTCGYILRTDMLKIVGGFDISLYRYFEDVDLIKRMRAFGWKTKYVGNVSFEHYGSGTSEKMSYVKNFYQSRNLMWFMKQNCINQNIINNIRYLFSYAVTLFRSALRSNDRSVMLKATVKGIWTGLFTGWKVNHEI